MSLHKTPEYQIPELIEALKLHRLPHDTPSQLADAFRTGFQAARALPVDGLDAWQPIETAPKDGTAILLGARGGSWIGKWLPVYTSGYVPDNKWSSLMLNHDHMGEKWQQPTHWMPLPAAPAIHEGGEG
jgi:hypothetical protein